MVAPPAIPLTGLYTGRLQPLGYEGLPSGIDKRRIEQGEVGQLGLVGDEHGERLHHGGPDKAVHHYPAEHYDQWRIELPARANLFEPAGFGENLSTRGLLEKEVCLGDLWRLGDVLLQVSQGRQPCRRLNLRFDQADMIERLQASGRTGWYYRVLEGGRVRQGDMLFLVERPHPEWPVERLRLVLFGPTPDRRALAQLTRLPVLSRSWRERAGRRLIGPTGACSASGR